MPRKKKMPVGGGTSKKDRLNSLFNTLKKKHPGHIHRASEYTSPWLIKRLPTGIVDLDIALSGGLPAGGMTFFVGKQSSGKNWLANQVIREQQIRLGDDCAIGIISTEMPYDKLFARKCGVRVALSPDEVEKYAQDYFDITGEELSESELEDLSTEEGAFFMVSPSIAEIALNTAIDFIKSRDFDVVLIDSFGALLTEHDDDIDLVDAPRVGGAALLNTQFSKKLMAALGPDENGEPNMTTVIGINQARSNLKAANKYSPELAESGGYALKHARWVTVDLSSSAKIRDKDRNEIGKKINWRISKQKAGGHEGHTGYYDFYFDRVGIDVYEHTLRIADYYGVVERSGTWYSYNDVKLGQGIINAAKEVEALDLLPELKRKIMKAAKVACH